MVLETLLSVWIGAVVFVGSFIPFLLTGILGFMVWSMYSHRSVQPVRQATSTNSKADSNKVLIIDDYNDFVNECFEKEEESKNKPENPQKMRMKEKQKEKRRIRNRIAKKSRQRNRKK